MVRAIDDGDNDSSGRRQPRLGGCQKSSNKDVIVGATVNRSPGASIRELKRNQLAFDTFS
jgi:hypothetical protein